MNGTLLGSQQKDCVTVMVCNKNGIVFNDLIYQSIYQFNY